MRSPPARPAQDEVGSLFERYDYSTFYHTAGDDPLAAVPPFNAWLREARPRGYDLYDEVLVSAPTPYVEVRDRRTGRNRELLNLSSYNYLGISYRPEVKQAAARALERFGLGASGSPILSGSLEVHEELAQRVAAFKGKPAALIFPTGYSANIGFISALMRSGDHVVLDQYAHASIVDGAILSKAHTTYFRHNQPDHLDLRLARCQGKKLVVVEGVYSMDGDLCELPGILEVCRKHGARILIDEAHSTFLFGSKGRGVAEHFGVDEEVDFHLGTFSKSLGGQGGFVACSREVVEYASAYGRSRFFSCNLAPPIAAGLIAGLGIAESEPQLRERLWQNAAFLRSRFREERVDFGRSDSQIVPVLVGDDRKVFRVAEKIRERGIYLHPVAYPAVPKQRSRLRISISAAHEEKDLDEAARIIAEVLREQGVVPS